MDHVHWHAQSLGRCRALAHARSSGTDSDLLSSGVSWRNVRSFLSGCVYMMHAHTRASAAPVSVRCQSGTIIIIVVVITAAVITQHSSSGGRLRVALVQVDKKNDCGLTITNHSRFCTLLVTQPWERTSDKQYRSRNRKQQRSKTDCGQQGSIPQIPTGTYLKILPPMLQDASIPHGDHAHVDLRLWSMDIFKRS